MSSGSNPISNANIRDREYNKVPKQLKDDNVIPSVSEIPSFLTSIRHPRRSRSVSVGPQSEADAYETLAYREKLRRESRSDMKAATPKMDDKSIPDYFGITTSNNASSRYPAAGLPTPASSNLDLYKTVSGAETTMYTPLTPGSVASGSGNTSRRPSAERRQDEREEREMFSKLEKPRVRYDVEVITKLIVYAGTVSPPLPERSCADECYRHRLDRVRGWCDSF